MTRPREKIKEEEGGEGFECSYKCSSWKMYNNISRESHKNVGHLRFFVSVCGCGRCLSESSYQFVFSMPAGRILRGVSAEFGTLVVPRTVFRSPVVVTGSPPSSSLCVRAQGRWWTSLWMKMVRASSTVCTATFHVSFVVLL